MEPDNKRLSFRVIAAAGAGSPPGGQRNSRNSRAARASGYWRQRLSHSDRRIAQ